MIRKRRVQRNKQQKLAKELWVGQSTTTKIENGRINPSYKPADRIFDFPDSYSFAKLGTAGEIATKPLSPSVSRTR